MKNDNLKPLKIVFLILVCICLFLNSFLIVFGIHKQYKDSECIKEPVYVENVSKPIKRTNESDYNVLTGLTYDDPFNVSLTGVPFDSTSFNDNKIAYYRFNSQDNGAFIDMTIAQDCGRPEFLENMTNFQIYNYSLFVTFKHYNMNEAELMYYWLYFNTLSLDVPFSSDFPFEELSVNSGISLIQDFTISRLGLTMGIHEEGVSYCNFILATYSNSYDREEYTFDDYQYYEFGIQLDDCEVSSNTATLNNHVFLTPYISYMFGYDLGYTDGYTNGYDSVVDDEGFLGGIFSLFERASNVFVSVMNVSIFPGITLGTIVLFPLVILLISIIIKLFFGG